MESCERISRAEDCLENICGRLSELVHVIDTVYLGLMCEKMEQQALDCVMCIGYAVKGVQDTVEKTLLEIREEAVQE